MRSFLQFYIDPAYIERDSYYKILQEEIENEKIKFRAAFFLALIMIFSSVQGIGTHLALTETECRRGADDGL